MIIVGVVALMAGLVDCRSRFLWSSLSLMVLVFAVIPSNGAWIHDYWNFPILLALFPGFSVMIEWATGFIKEKIKPINQSTLMPIASSVFLLLFFVLVYVMQPTKLHEKYFIEKIKDFLDEGDLVIDGGNSFYLDSEENGLALEQKKIKIMGMVVSSLDEVEINSPAIIFP